MNHKDLKIFCALAAVGLGARAPAAEWPPILPEDLQMTREEKAPKAIEFSGPERDSDVFEISLPAGFAVEDLPDPVQVKTDFATYQSKTEVVGQLLRYTRTFEIKTVSLPAARAPELKSLYRTIAADERGSVVLKRLAAD